MPPVHQRSFAGGELDPRLYGRTDLPRFRESLRRCRNVIPTAEGALLNRPGTKYVNTTETQSEESRLIPFIFSSDQSYVLEFGDMYFRVHYRGAYLSVQVATTYAVADIWDIKYVQSGDVLTLVHPGYPVREVTRTAHTTWGIGDKLFASAQSPPTGGGRTLDAVTTPLKPWEVWVTAVNADGEESDTLQVVTQPTHGNYCAEVGNTSTGLGTTNLYSWTGAAGAVLYRVYRGQNGVGGHIGDSFTTSFRDDGQAPNFADQPPQGSAPFGSSSNRPSAATYFEQRQLFAATLNEPATLWGSQTGLFYNFDRQTPPVADDAIKFALAARQYEEIRHLVPADSGLFLLTNSAEWRAEGGGTEEPIAATSIRARPRSYNGAASTPQALVGDDVAFYVQERGARVRELIFTLQRDGYTGGDLSLFAHHLLEGRTIVDWAFQKVPYSILWMACDDGVLLSCTYDRDKQVVAWAQHDTSQPEQIVESGPDIVGAFESVCVVPEGDEDVLYFIVRRDYSLSATSNRRNVERMSTRQVSDARLGVFVDAAVSYDGRNTGATTVTVQQYLGGGYAVGATVTVTASANIFASADANSGQNAYVVLNPDASEYAVLSRITTVVRLKITTFVSATEVRATVENVAVPVEYRTAATTYWGIARCIIAGLAHLNNSGTGGALGRTCKILTDGNPTADDIAVGTYVTDGLQFSATNPPPWAGCIVHAGLPIVSEVDLLDVPYDSKKGAPKLVSRVGAEVRVPSTYQFFAGQSVDDELEPQPNSRSLPISPAGAVEIDVVNVTLKIQGEWNSRGQAAIQHVDPLPFEVLSVWREVEFGDLE